MAGVSDTVRTGAVTILTRGKLFSKLISGPINETLFLKVNMSYREMPPVQREKKMGTSVVFALL